MDYNIIIPSLISGAVTALGAILGFIATQKSTKQKEKEARNKELKNLEDRLTTQLTEHKAEYLSQIGDVKKSIRSLEDNFSEIRATTQQFQAVIECKIEELSNRVEKHNTVIERTYALEKAVGILENKEKVSEHRLDDLEKKQ